MKSILFIFLLLLSLFPRFVQLGYSNFYGDETKTLYTNKTIPALTFFFDQRKGPVQFLVGWFMENATDSFSEFWMRLPYAMAGFLTIIVFYFFVKRFFGYGVSLFATTLFSFNGFNIAFSRTAQYQNFLLLFGFLSILFLTYFLETRYKKFLFLTSVFLALSFYSHYDALFFVFPIIYFLYPILKDKELSIGHFVLFFIVPFLLLMSVFYVPYIYLGYFYSNAFNYIQRRFTGSEFLPNNSWYTFFVYNPVFSSILLLLFSLVPIFRLKTSVKKFFVLWFFLTFFVYEFLILNPGTHIHLYFIPLYVLAGVGFFEILTSVKSRFFTGLLSFSVVLLMITSIGVLTYVFVPSLNQGYPWKNDTALFLNLPKAGKNYHLYLYGFPYNKPWEEINTFMLEQSGVRGFYTNDNDILAKYYLPTFDYTAPGSNFLPQYYIFIPDSQQLGAKDLIISEEDLLKYLVVKEFTLNGEVQARIYKLSVGSENPEIKL